MEDLIAKTNALEGFTARYRVTEVGGNNGSLTLCYAAPDRGAILQEFGEVGGGQWLSGTQFTMVSRDPPKSPMFVSMDMRALNAERAAVTDLLLSEFPPPSRSQGALQEPGVYFVWTWSSKPSSKGADSNPERADDAWSTEVEVQVGFEPHRKGLLDWLRRMQQQTEPPMETADAWTWTLPNGGEAQVSKSTGFVTRVALQKPDGSRTEFELESLELGAPAETLLAAPTAPPPGAQVETADWEAGMRLGACLSTRQEVWNGLSRAIEDGRLVWGEESEQKLARVFQAVQSQFARRRVADWTPAVREWIDTSVEEAAARARGLTLSDEQRRAGWKKHRERAIDALNQKFDKQLQECLSLEAPDSVRPTFRLMDVFLRCERAAACAEFERQVRGPLLAYLDERVDAALAR